MLTEIPAINITTEPIELCKLLKIANMVSGGGEAKIVISEGYVYVNGEVEFQKRKKIYNQDTIEFNGEIIQVFLNNPSTSSDSSHIKTKVTKPKKDKKSKNKKPIAETEINTTETTVKKGKRKPISF